jgi:hypothetical protein
MTATTGRAAGEAAARAVQVALGVLATVAVVVAVVPGQLANTIRVGLAAVAAVALLAAARTLVPSGPRPATRLDVLPPPPPDAFPVPETLRSLEQALRQTHWRTRGSLAVGPTIRSRLRQLADESLRPLGGSIDHGPGRAVAEQLLTPETMEALAPGNIYQSSAIARRNDPAYAIHFVLDDLGRLDAASGSPAPVDGR